MKTKEQITTLATTIKTTKAKTTKKIQSATTAKVIPIFQKDFSQVAYLFLSQKSTC